MRDSFILYTEYARHIELLSMEQRGLLLTAVFAYQTGDDLPEMDAVTGMAFAFISAQLERDNLRYDETCKKRSEAGKLGGRPRKADDLQENQEKAKKAKGFSEKQTKAKKADNDYDYDNDIIPPISPQEGEGGESSKEKFFSLYPKLKTQKRLNDAHVDYAILIERFAQSKHLRNLYSMKVVLDKYEAIIAGEFDDGKMAESKTDNRGEREIAADLRAARERFYAARRQRAEAESNRVGSIVEEDEAFRVAETACKRVEIEAAKAEVFAPASLPEINARLAKHRAERSAALARLGFSEEDLKPKFICSKCSDTGFLPDGKMCDCYEKENHQ